MEHRLFNTGDQVWVKNGQTVKLITHNGMCWEQGQNGYHRSMRPYQIHHDGGQTWFSQRYGTWQVIKIISHDGKVWSEDCPVVTALSGAEMLVHKVQSFLTKLILQVLS